MQLVPTISEGVTYAREILTYYFNFFSDKIGLENGKKFFRGKFSRENERKNVVSGKNKKKKFASWQFKIVDFPMKKSSREMAKKLLPGNFSEKARIRATLTGIRNFF